MQTCWHVKARGWQSTARDTHISKACVFEPREDWRVNIRIWTEADMHVSVHGCASRRVVVRLVWGWHMCMLVPVAFLSPKLWLCEKVCLHVCVSLWT